MTSRYDLMTARAGNDGKTYWTKVGSMWPMQGRDGFSLSFDALPVPALKDGKLEVRVVAFPPKEREERQSGPAGGNAHMDDSIPFAPEW